MTNNLQSTNTTAISPWISRFADRVRKTGPANGSVLDLACGEGRHTAFFLDKGFGVTAVDRDVSALLPNKNLEILACDLEGGSPWPLGSRQFDAVIVVNYLYRPILPRIIAAVAPGGILLYDTFAIGNAAYGRPKNPDFLLQSGELRAAVGGELEVLDYFHGLVAAPQPAIRQQICARRS
ncbi:MAG: class I SAM-dependent methyltransferase [Alphaproteobacteria bacterium]|nr:class I SAM-dependent methyltransferase [Alphaproteobacteria bacterium]